MIKNDTITVIICANDDSNRLAYFTTVDSTCHAIDRFFYLNALYIGQCYEKSIVVFVVISHEYVPAIILFFLFPV